MRNTALYIFAAIALLLTVSCEKAEFLNRAPYSSTAPENFYSTESQMNMALVSCYETMNTHKIPGLTYCQRGSNASIRHSRIPFTCSSSSNACSAAPRSTNIS